MNTRRSRSMALVALVILTSCGASPPVRRDTAAMQRTRARELRFDIDEGSSDGTVHAPERVRMSLGTLRPLELRTDIQRDEWAPFPSRQIAVGGGHHVILGVSSSGGGMETRHVLLVSETGNTLRLDARLDVTMDRAASQLLIDDRGDTVRIGVPEPEAESMGPAVDWTLRLGADDLGIDGIRALPFEPVPENHPGLWVFGAQRLPRRVSWFEVRADGITAVGIDS